MEGYQWTFVTGIDSFPSILKYNGLPVWDMLMNVSVAHRSTNINWLCYCEPQISFDFTEIEEKVNQFAESVKSEVSAK